MKENGTVVYLYCDPHVIAERLREDTTRPLFQKKDIDAFVTKFESRRAYYEEAHIHIDTTNKSVKQIMNVLDILRFVTRQFVSYMDAPKEDRKQKKEQRRAEKEPFMNKWFGVILLSLCFVLPKCKSKKSS